MSPMVEGDEPLEAEQEISTVLKESLPGDASDGYDLAGNIVAKSFVLLIN